MIERVRNGALSRPPARAVMFDFDGTIALVRAGWMPIMLDMMMETLAPLAADAASLRSEAEDYVARLTGKDTLHQMEAFARHVRELGGHAEPAAAYKAEFIRRIDRLRIERLSAIEQGAMPPDALLVPGIRNLLQNLRDRGLQLYLASGSAHEEICMESDLLGIAHYFDGIYGSAPASRTKRELLEWLTSSGIPGNRILTFGDGRVEIEDTRAIGGTAVGVATDEPACRDVDCRKRGWLIDAGADYIIPNYLEEDLLLLVSGEI